jgi:hypothetical protein
MNSVRAVSLSLIVCMFGACTDQGSNCPDSGLGDGGNSCPGDGTDASSDGGAVKRIFVTSAAYNGDLRTAGNAATGLQGGDFLCNQAAQAALLGGTWVAWLSDETHDAIDRINDVGPWFLVDGQTRVFNNKANLTTTPLASINQDETGVEVLPITPYVWTGTQNGGRVSSQLHCENWTGGFEGRIGFFRGATWTSHDTNNCVFNQRLFCLEQ